jgi:hypothetical protein
MEKDVTFTSRTPTYLTPEQRYTMTQIPADLSDREIARHYTFTQKDLDLISQRRRHHNRLGFAVQLAVLRFPVIESRYTSIRQSLLSLYHALDEPPGAPE